MQGKEESILPFSLSLRFSLAPPSPFESLGLLILPMDSRPWKHTIHVLFRTSSLLLLLLQVNGRLTACFLCTSRSVNSPLSGGHAMHILSTS